MIFGIGTDIIETDRIEKQLLNNDGFKEQIFTSNEIKYCESKKDASKNYAARFAAKEAFFKAIGTGLRDGLSFLDVEIVNDNLGKPEINLYGKAKDFFNENKLEKVHVSLSHIREFSNAMVTIEK